ncbi:MAG: phosphopantetheine-binding protein [Clostridia bacterium]|nr:phosphopantetheine-binding protein [Clostridia bacterium]
MLEKIIGILREYKDNPALNITEKTTFADLTLDSLDIVELVVRIEEQLNISVEMSEDIQTVGDLAKSIQNAL